MTFAALVFAPWRSLATDDAPSAPVRMMISVHVLGHSDYAGAIESADGSSTPLSFAQDGSGTSLATALVNLHPQLDGRDQEIVRVWRRGNRQTQERLPLSIVTFAAPSSIRLDFPDAVQQSCGLRYRGSGGEAFWVGQYLRENLQFSACSAESRDSQLTLASLGGYLLAYNHLVDVDPTLYSANNELVNTATDTISSADLCASHPIIECLFLQRQITAAQVADYKLLAVALSVEPMEARLSNEGLVEVLSELQEATSAFDRCATGDLKGKCDLHTNRAYYVRASAHFCALAKQRGVTDLSSYCPGP